MELRPIKTELDYQNALKEIEQLFDVEPRSPLKDRLDILATLVEAYEQKHYPIEAPDPISAILYYLEARGLSEQDLVDYIGTREQVTAILNKQQPLTLDIIRRLNQNLGIPAEILIKPYSLMKTSA
ncbi:MAG: transcriptional regulator [Prochloraceae cyanobacterium]|nr:transcriptional regulator [Prochloraceae cyanobacterium]